MSMQRRRAKQTGKHWRFGEFTLPLRGVEVPSHGAFPVPRHIVRIDIDKPGKGRTHGWQVRYSGTSFFSDSRYKGDPTKALNAAKRFLKQEYIASPPKPAKLPVGEVASRKTILLSQRGVSFTWRRSKKRPTILQLYCQVSIPIPGERKSRNLSLYVGTHKTVTDDAIKKAIATGTAIRRFAEKRYADGDAESLKSLSMSSLPKGIRISASKLSPPRITLRDLQRLNSYKNNVPAAA
jgi:hypothetical protein